MNTLTDLEYLLAIVCAFAFVGLCFLGAHILTYFECKKLKKQFLEESKKYDQWEAELVSQQKD